jgi:hypothetical protein
MFNGWPLAAATTGTFEILAFSAQLSPEIYLQRSVGRDLSAGDLSLLVGGWRGACFAKAKALALKGLEIPAQFIDLQHVAGRSGKAMHMHTKCHHPTTFMKFCNTCCLVFCVLWLLIWRDFPGPIVRQNLLPILFLTCRTPASYKLSPRGHYRLTDSRHFPQHLPFIMARFVKYASWTSGIAAVPDSDHLGDLTLDGFGSHLNLTQDAVESIILFVPISTPVLIDNQRLNADLVIVRFSSNSSAAKITDVQLFDGEETLMEYRNENKFGTIDLGQWKVKNSPGVKWGLVVAITVKFDGTDPSGGNFNLFGAGVEFTVPDNK